MAGVDVRRADARRVRVASEARGARRAARGVRALPRDEQARRHGDGVRRGGAASGLVSDSAAGLLDRAARRQLESAPARAARRHAGRADRSRARSSFPASTMPRRLRSRRRSSVSTPMPRRNPLAFLMTPAVGAHQREPQPTIDLFHAGGREAEIEEVFRRILADRRVARPGRDRVRVGRARRAGLGEGAPPRLAGHARARHPGRVHASGPRAARPLRLDRNRLRGRPLPPPAAVGRPRRRGGRRGLHRGPGRARRSRARRPAGGARRTASRSARLRKSYEARADGSGRVGRRPRGRAGRRPTQTTQRSRAGSPTLVGSIPEPAADGTVPLQAVVDAASRRSSSARPRAAAARSIIGPRRRSRDYVGELRALGAFSCALPEALRFIRERVAVAHGRARASAARSSLRVHACRRPATPAARISSSSASRKDACFRRSTEDAVLLDEERAAISPALAAVDRPDRRSGATAVLSAARRRPAAHASRSATRAGTRASSARRTPRG